MKEPVFRRFLIRFSWLLAILLMATMGFSHVIDPYGLAGIGPIDGLNQLKPASYTHPDQEKLSRRARSNPKTILLGNSRIDGGLDPQSSLWPESWQPVFNLGLPGAGISRQARALFAQSHDRIETIIIGLDYLDFRTDCRPSIQQSRETAARLEAPLFIKTHLSLTALTDSFLTVAQQANPDVRHMTDQGFNPWNDIRPFYRSEGQATVVRQRNQENIANYLSRPRTVSCADKEDDWAKLAAMLDRLQDQQVILFFHPYHADLLVSAHLTGLWPALEQSKRQATELAEARPHVQLWDFAAFHRFAREAVPAPSDRQARMIYYYEGGHYRPALGDLIIARILGTDGSTFGVELTSDTIEERLAAVRDGLADYQRAQPQAYDRVKALIKVN